MDKQSARSRFLRLRQDYLSNSSEQELRQNICRQLLPLLQEQKGVWAAYQSASFEADPGDAVRQAPWLKWAYPRVHGNQLKFYLPHTSDDFEEGRWKIKEPILSRSQAVETGDIAGFLVPGVAFDHQGRRVGLGKGYYDRVLESSQAMKVGVSLQVQVSSMELPVESHDIPMDFVVTDGFVLKTSDREFERENQWTQR